MSIFGLILTFLFILNSEIWLIWRPRNLSSEIWCQIFYGITKVLKFRLLWKKVHPISQFKSHKTTLARVLSHRLLTLMRSTYWIWFLERSSVVTHVQCLSIKCHGSEESAASTQLNLPHMGSSCQGFSSIPSACKNKEKANK